MRLNPFYWLRIVVGKLVMQTTGTWIGSYVDDVLPHGGHYKDGSEQMDLEESASSSNSVESEADGNSGESKLDVQ